MNCLGVYIAIYDYQSQTEEEISIQTNDMLILTDNTDSDWWTVTLKSQDAFQEVATGLVPSTYIEPVINILAY